MPDGRKAQVEVKFPHYVPIAQQALINVAQPFLVEYPSGSVATFRKASEPKPKPKGSGKHEKISKPKTSGKGFKTNEKTS